MSPRPDSAREGERKVLMRPGNPLRVTDADLIVRGTILTMGIRQPTAKALAVGRGRVLAIGTEGHADRWRGKRTKEWTLRRAQTIVPGFIDAHAHLATDAWRRTWVQLEGCGSLEEALDRLAARISGTRKGDWIIGRGWDESTWPVKRYLNHNDLDRVSVSLPILVNRIDGHLCSVNSVVLRRLDFASDAGVERSPDGTPTGVLKEAAAERAREAMPSPTDADWAGLLGRAIAHLHTLGITSVHDIVDDRHMRAYQRLRRQGRLAIRAYLCPYDDLLDPLTAAGMQTGFGDEWLRLGPIKVFADGSLGARTAALHHAYEDARGNGQLNRPPRDLTALLAKAHRAGLQLAVHAIGDRAIDATVGAFERILDRDPRDDHRHRIEHFELPTDEALSRMKELGLVASMQPNFVARWSGPGGLYERRLGGDRLRRNNPFRLVRRRRIPLAFGSDGMPYGPLYGLGGAVAAPFESQRLTMVDAIRSYTAEGAYAAFAESEVGTLAVGKLADFVVLSGDPREADPRTVAVEATIVGGDVVFRRKGDS